MFCLKGLLFARLSTSLNDFTVMYWMVLGWCPAVGAALTGGKGEGGEHLCGYFLLAGVNPPHLQIFQSPNLKPFAKVGTGV